MEMVQNFFGENLQMIVISWSVCPWLRLHEPYSQHFFFFVTYKFAQ